jgi:dienelactone hydrolase
MILEYVIIATLFFFIGVIFFLHTIVCFRKPTGKYGIGTSQYHWVDASRKELNDEQDAYRELMVYVYYPIDDKNKKATMPYDKDALARQKAFVYLKSKIPPILLTGWDSLKTYAQNNNNVARAKSEYPVIIISNSASTMVQHYSWLLEELASHGYIVVGVNHPYMASITRFPDGRVINSLIAHKKSISKQEYEAWKQQQTSTCTGDIDFVVTKLEELTTSLGILHERLDLNRVGIAGHSFAGDIALLAGSSNKTIHAIVNMDGGERVFRYNKIKEPFTVPCLMILGEKSHQWRGECGVNDLKTLDAFCNEHKQNVSKITLQDVGHGVFGDLPILLNSTLFTRITSYVFDFDLDASAPKGCKAIDRTSISVIDFFDKHLK